MKTDISVIIVTYNSEKVIYDCISSIYNHTQDISYEIIVIDNDSTDSTCSIIKSFTDVILIKNSKNIGFGAACNIGINSCKGEYIFLLNPDTTLHNNALKIFSDFMQKEMNNIGIVGTWLKSGDGYDTHSFGNFTTPWFFLGETLFPMIRLKIARDLLAEKLHFTKFDDYTLVDYVTGANMFAPAELLKEEMFDADFFLYAEEVDLQFRLAKKGVHSAIIKGPDIRHLKGHSFSSNNTRRILMLNGMLKYLYKHFPVKATITKYIFIIVILLRIVFSANDDYSRKDDLALLFLFLKRKSGS